MKVLKFIFKTIWPFRFYFLGPLAMICVHALDLSLRPYLTKLLVDIVSNKSGMEAIHEMREIAILYMLILFLVPIAARIYDWCCLKYEPMLKGRIANTMVSRITLQTHNFFQKHFAGSLANKVNDTVKYIPELLTLALNAFITNFVSIIVAIYVLWTIHIWFAVAMSIWAIVFIAMSIFVVRKFTDLARVNSEASSRVVGNIVDILGNISTVRLFGSRDHELEKLEDIQDQYVRTTRKRRWFSLKFYLIQGIIFAAYQSICLLMLVYLYGISEVTAGDFAMLLSINMSIVTSLWHMTDDMKIFSENWGAVEQAIKIFDIPIEIEDTEDAKELIVYSGRISLDKVNFHHKGDKALFSDLSLDIEAGQKIGLVGYSGSGKTTFVNLILRLYELNSGNILIDNQDIKSVSLDSLRKAFAVIPQDPALFHRDLLENIRYGKETATDSEVVQAAKKASAHSFITALPKGYYSHVGEKAVKLSAGQRQRISIARAILKNSPILIFDEATSNLDAITENFIQENLTNLMQDKTTIVIAHRLSTLKSMDRILVFEHGSIVQDGAPDVLLKQDGLFKKLWDAQAGGLLPTKPSGE